MTFMPLNPHILRSEDTCKQGSCRRMHYQLCQHLPKTSFPSNKAEEMQPVSANMHDPSYPLLFPATYEELSSTHYLFCQLLFQFQQSLRESKSTHHKNGRALLLLR